MNVQCYASGKKILSSGTVYSFEQDGDITLKLEFDETFAFDVVFKFVNTEDGIINAKNEVVGNSLVFTCTNFNSDIGSGTTTPVNIATYEHKTVYLAFGIQRTGDNSLRRLHYTLFIEE